jgi:hypothetical protein
LMDEPVHEPAPVAAVAALPAGLSVLLEAAYGGVPGTNLSPDVKAVLVDWFRESVPPLGVVFTHPGFTAVRFH